MRRVSRLAPLLLLLLLPQPSAAQARQQTAAEKMLGVAFSLRRAGEFRAAAAMFDQVLQRLARDPRKRQVAHEAAQLYLVMGEPVKALLLYRKNHDYDHELEILLDLGEQDRRRWEEALTVARLVKHPEGEARALSKLGRHAEALRILDAQGGRLDRVKAEVLLAAGRAREAAALFGSLEDYYRQAKALQQARDAGASRAWQDAVAQLEFTAKNESMAAVRRAKQAFDQAQGGVARERARLLLAEAYGKFAEDYRRLAEAFFNAGRPPSVARQLAGNAVKFLKLQRQTLEDAQGQGGGDAYGVAAVKAWGLEARIAEVQAEASKYQ